MKLKIHTKVFSCIMIVALLICSVQTVNAAEYIRDIDISDSQSVFLSEKDLPEAVESEITSEKGHIKRLSSKETRLDTIIFANADGSETIYIFDENVKYTDSSGNTHDKSNLLYATERSKYQYTNKDNDIQTFFPITLNAATGVILEHDDISIEMYPATTVSATAIKKKDSSGTEYVYYDNAFGPKTSLRYKTTFSGFKEEIVLYENVGSTFRFYVECGDLIPTINNGIIEFYSSSENLVVASIDSIFVYDSYIGVATDERHETWNNTDGNGISIADELLKSTALSGQEFENVLFKGKTEEEQQVIRNNMKSVEIVVYGESADTLVIDYYPSIGYAYSANTYYEITSELKNLLD